MCKILNRIKEYIDYKGIPIAAFERSVGMSNASFSKQLKNHGAIGSDKIENILSVYPELSTEWLLTGRGNMLNEASFNPQYNVESLVISDTKGIPLIPFDAMAGYFSGEMSVNESDCEKLIIPGLRADFVIPVRGDSMEPKFYSGDFVACQNVVLRDIFFQWGKAYVIDTNQGVLLKKVKRGSSASTITLVSENEEYEPFEIPIESIYHIALVKGLIRIS